MHRDEYEELGRLAVAVARAAGAGDPELVRDQVMERLLLAPEPVEHRRAWIRVAARRLAIDAHRAQERRGGPVHSYVEGDDLHGPDWVPSPSAEVRRGLYAQQLLDGLAPRDANMLRDWADGWTAAEMGERYDLAPGTVQVHLTRLRGRLRAVADRDAADLD